MLLMRRRGALPTCSCSCPALVAILADRCSPVWLQALLGDLHSQHALRAAIERLVTLRRHEHFTVHQAVQHIRLTTITALWPPSSQGEAPAVSTF